MNRNWSNQKANPAIKTKTGKSLLHQGISESIGDLIYTFKKLIGSFRMTDLSDQFRKVHVIIRYKVIGYNLNVMRQSACLVIIPITVDNFATLFNCTPVDRASDSMMAQPKAITFRWLGPELYRLLLGPPGLN